MAEIKSVCSNCHAEGVIVGGCLDALPTTVICGACQKSYRHAATALERIAADDVTDPEKPFYLKVYQKPWNTRKAPTAISESRELSWGEQRLARLKKLSTKRLLSLLKIARHHNYVTYREAELKTELATREHVPRKC